MSSAPPVIPVFKRGNAIPRIVHQVFFNGSDGANMPGAIRENVDRLIAANPGWEHRLYDEAAMERFIRDEYGADTLDYFQRIDPRYAAARVDFFRYLLMYRTGGIYLDIKSGATKALDEVSGISEPYAISQWDNAPGGTHIGWGFHSPLADIPGGEFQIFHIICVPGHAFLRAAATRVLDNIERYRPWRDGVGRDGVLFLSGPIPYTLAIAPLLTKNPHRRFHDERDLGLISNIFGDGQHRGIFRTHYALSAAPIIRRSGLAGTLDRAFTAPIRGFYALLAIKARLGVYVRAKPALARRLKAIGIIS